MKKYRMGQLVYYITSPTHIEQATVLLDCSGSYLVKSTTTNKVETIRDYKLFYDGLDAYDYLKQNKNDYRRSIKV